MIVEDQVAEELFLQSCAAYRKNSKSITDYEREILGTDHCEVGSLLAQDWNVPEEVQDGIANHHKKLRYVSPSSVTGITQISVYIVTRMNYPPLSGMDAVISADLADHIRENMDEYKALARDLPDEMSKARELYESEEEATDGISQ